MNNAITVKGLKKSYQKTPVLNGVTFEVGKGQIFALLGANGAGKTTTINILTTLLNADGGSATVHGFDTAKQADKVRNHISLTGQFAAVDDVLTGRENLVLVGELRHVASPAKIAQDLLAKFDLTDAADRSVSTYSGGMRRRLDIAMSLIGNPAIIFLDEPTTGLDPQSRTMMWEMIKGLAKDGTTVFLTTQYLEEADQLADHIAILNKGKIVAEGTAASLKSLLPGGKIELRFNDAKQLAQAAKLFASLEISTDAESNTLAIVTDGSVKQVARILNALDAHTIEVAEFAQKMPTLDDVFFEVVSQKGEK
jgi:ABC-2 type transport system ATP-binding protein